MKKSVEIEEALHDVYKETDLLKFEAKLALEKQLTRLDHFDVVTDEELMSYGLSAPAIRRLRTALDKRKKAAKKGKSKIFTLGKKTGNQSKIIVAQFESGENHQSSPEPTPSTPCLIGRDEIKLMETLGEGTFAVVKRAIWNKPTGQKVDCAVKILREISEEMKTDLHAEIMNMQKLRHTNLIQLHGIVYGEPTLMVIEFCDGGALLDRLRDSNKPVLLVTRLLNYAQQIASGMAYLESRRCVHRDLAARNVLLADNEEIVKICDFGMTRHLNENERLYVMSGMKKVPFSWCPPESLSRRQFSHHSDVWAFGVLLWELYTYGEEPWAGYRAADVLRMTEGGERLKQPEKASKELYDLMMMCWQLQMENRPKFSLLRQLLKEIRFMMAECRTDHPAETSTELSLTSGDRVIIISERDQRNWYGQSTKSGLFGTFSRSVVAIKTSRQPTTNHLSPTKDSSHISRPIPGSFIHTGHGDINDKNCWGYVEKIDPIYLQNPILRPSSSKTSSHVNFISSAAVLDATPRVLPVSTQQVTSRTSPPRPAKPVEGRPHTSSTNNFTHKFEDDFKPRSSSHETMLARPSSAIPFPSAQQPTTNNHIPPLPPPLTTKQRVSPPPKPTRRPVSITPEVQAAAMMRTPVLEPIPASTSTKQHNTSVNHVNFRPTAITHLAQQSRQTPSITPVAVSHDDEMKRNTIAGGVRPSLEQLQRQKEAFGWINLETITNAREKLSQPKMENQTSLPKTNSASVLSSTPIHAAPKKQTTPPPILAENFIAALSGSTSSLSSMNDKSSSSSFPSTSSIHAKIPTSTPTLVPQLMIPAQPTLRSTISTPTMTTSSASSTIRVSMANIPLSTTTTNSAPSTIRVSTANIPSSTNGFILSSSSTNSAPSTVRVPITTEKISSPEKARPQVSSLFQPTNTNKSISKPIANIQPYVPSTSLSSFPDPFLISDDVKTIAAKARYSQVHTKLVAPMEILAGGGHVSNGFMPSSSSNDYFSNTPSFNTLLYPTAKPSTGLYPSTAGMNTYGSKIPSHTPQSSDELLYSAAKSSTNGLHSATMPSKSGYGSNIPPSLDELLYSAAKSSTNGLHSSTMPSKSGYGSNIPPSSDELFPELKSTSILHPIKVDTSRPGSLPLSSTSESVNKTVINNPISAPSTNLTAKTPTMAHVTPAHPISSSTNTLSHNRSTNATVPTMVNPKTSSPNYSSLLPPPSPLLLSGQSTTPSTSNTLPPPSTVLPRTSNSINLTPMYPNSIAPPPVNTQPLPLQPAPLYVAGNSSNLGWNPMYMPSYNNPASQFSTWPMGQPTSNFYTPNLGTTILQPTRASEPPVLQPVPAMPLPASGSSNPISLDFLDSSSNDDESIAKVRSLFDGASIDKCRQFLRKCNGNINQTVCELKISQLLEIGIAGDRELARSALDSCQWDVNAAAERLLTS